MNYILELIKKTYIIMHRLKLNLNFIITVDTTKSVTTTKVAAKPVSPFAKFRQLDHQSSTQSSPK